MKKTKISEAMGNINEKYIEEAAAYTGPSKIINRNKWIKLGAMAACLAVAIIGVGLWLPSLQDLNPDSGTNTTNPPQYTNPLNRPYKSYIRSTERAVEWPWEYKTAYEKYYSVTFNGVTFNTRVQAIDKSLLGDMLGSCTATGYDIYTETTHTDEFQVYKINGVSKEKLVAVDMDGQFCVYMLDDNNPPSTLGALIEAYNLTETLELSRFASHKKNEPTGYFNIEDDNFIWDILSSCEDAAFINDDTWTRGDRDYISFTVTSKTLGAYKLAFYVTEDGYIWTNVFSRAHLYHIGEEAASQIIDYAMSHATKGHYEPYLYTMGGIITEINHDYVLIDDSVLCVNPEDGILFKVPMDNLYIKRAIEHLRIEVGDLVQVEFTGDVDVDGGYIVNGAVSMSEAILSDGNMVVPE